MAQSVKTIVDINGTKIENFSSLKLSQGIYAHHSFRLECPIEEVNKNVGGIFNEPENYIGVPVQIKVESPSDQSVLFFSGLVTQVEASCNYGEPEKIIFSGFSPTILLEDGLYSKSWIRNSVKSIVTEISKQFPTDLLKYCINPDNRETFNYTVRYKETAWQFINRLAATYGEWLFYDGEKLVVGKSGGRTVHLTYGIQLRKFGREMKLKPNCEEWAAYDCVKNEVYNSRIENIADIAGHTDIGASVLKKSAELYEAKSTCWYDHTVRKKKQLDDIARILAIKQVSDVVRIQGSSDMPGFQPGDTIIVKTSNADDQADQSLGDYRIISIDHCWDGTGNYSNEFVAIPATVKIPPIASLIKPYCEKQHAVVVDNHDVDKLGRIQVRFRWMDDTQECPWVQVVTQYAGNNKGLYMMPEVGEEVIVEFAGGDPTQPYVTGTVHHGKATTEFGNAENDIKAIQTRSGIKIIMNDKEGSLSLEDKNGNGVQMDGDGIVTMKSKDKIVLACGDSKIIMDKDGTIEINGRTIKMDGTEEVNITSSDLAKINAKMMVKVSSTMIKLN
jgi:Rhs element Vgr protein